MKKHSFGKFYKNAVGTVFLLIGAFFVCSTLLSMRAVLADPIAPVFGASAPAGQSAQSGRASARTNPRTNAQVAARPTRQTKASTANRGVSGRNVVARENTTTNASPARTTTSSRAVVARTASRATTRDTANRNVRARNTAASRVSVAGDVIRGSKSNVNTTYTYLNKGLYTGNYSNIIDSTTGLISADAYSTCLSAYYTCMDEICTARNESQRRCACAGRVKTFAAAEDALESANSELLKIAGQVALLEATKGKDVSAAFTLTDAEQVMNCVSWKDVKEHYGASSPEAKEWCYIHGIYGASQSTITIDGTTKTGYYVSSCDAPSYCYATGSGANNFGFDVNNITGNSSDILATLATWADTIKENTNTILKTDNNAVSDALSSVIGAVNGITGSVINLSETVEDSLSETWGYDLFRYAHNNVCARVLDSCFNGIYEACGTPPSGGRCANGATSSCPYNYNSTITISSSGDVTLNERSTAGTNASASCFGYTNTSGDPYSALRGPVADARRSVMQKYLLDANADCDLYGEQLKTAAQKINYQKVAAQQALQQKRLTYYNEEQAKILSDAIAAGTNFNECISELYDCYETANSAHTDWTTARIKTYCAQIANSPHCYQDMICNPSYAQFKAIIDTADSTSCTWHSSDYTKNTCRNVVTLNEILNGAAETGCKPGSTNCTDSAKMREQCLQDALCDDRDCGPRTWEK